MRTFRRRAARRALVAAKRRALERGIDAAWRGMPLMREAERLMSKPWDAPGRPEAMRAITARVQAHTAVVDGYIATYHAISRRLERTTR